MVSFGVGFLLATRVVFPRPVTADAGVAVPALYGRERADAEREVAENGLAVGTVTEMASTTAPAGEVLAQDPVPGQELRPGAAVSFAVSSGPPDLRVPSLTGLGAATARALLERAGFQVRVQQVQDDRLPRGAVSGTDPESGTAMPLPASVLLLVSSGPSGGADSPGTAPPGGT